MEVCHLIEGTPLDVFEEDTDNGGYYGTITALREELANLETDDSPPSSECPPTAHPQDVFDEYIRLSLERSYLFQLKTLLHSLQSIENEQDPALLAFKASTIPTSLSSISRQSNFSQSSDSRADWSEGELMTRMKRKLTESRRKVSNSLRRLILDESLADVPVIVQLIAAYESDRLWVDYDHGAETNSADITPSNAPSSHELPETHPSHAIAESVATKAENTRCMNLLTKKLWLRPERLLQALSVAGDVGNAEVQWLSILQILASTTSVTLMTQKRKLEARLSEFRSSPRVSDSRRPAPQPLLDVNPADVVEGDDSLLTSSGSAYCDHIIESARVAIYEELMRLSTLLFPIDRMRTSDNSTWAHGQFKVMQRAIVSWVRFSEDVSQTLLISNPDASEVLAPYRDYWIIMLSEVLTTAGAEITRRSRWQSDERALPFDEGRGDEYGPIPSCVEGSHPPVSRVAAFAVSTLKQWDEQVRLMVGPRRCQAPTPDECSLWFDLDTTVIGQTAQMLRDQWGEPKKDLKAVIVIPVLNGLFLFKKTIEDIAKVGETGKASKASQGGILNDLSGYAVLRESYGKALNAISDEIISMIRDWSRLCEDVNALDHYWLGRDESDQARTETILKQMLNGNVFVEVSEAFSEILTQKFFHFILDNFSDGGHVLREDRKRSRAVLAKNLERFQWVVEKLGLPRDQTHFIQIQQVQALLQAAAPVGHLDLPSKLIKAIRNVTG